MFVLVCFDIVADRARARAVKVIRDYGVRVQKSVFECAGLSEEQYLVLRDRLEAVIDQTEDSVRYYLLCGRCVERVEYAGLGECPRTEAFQVV